MSIARRIPGLADLWQQTTGEPQVRIAVIDGDVDASHTSLRDATLIHTSPGPGSGDAGPAILHGTQVASILFGKHGSQVEGIAPSCTGIIIPIFRDRNGVLLPSSENDLARAIGIAVQHGAHVINISGGKPSQSGQAHPLLENALKTAHDSGALVIGAAGNDGCFCQHIPSASQLVLPVGAMDQRGDPLPFSNWGAAYQQTGILALGESIPVAGPYDKSSEESGTSFATAIVSGIAGLLMSLQVKSGKPPDSDVVRRALLATAEGCSIKPVSDCRQLMVGRLNLVGAARLIADDGMSTSSAAKDSVVASKTAQLSMDDGEIKEALTDSLEVEPNMKGQPDMSPQHDTAREVDQLASVAPAAATKNASGEPAEDEPAVSRAPSSSARPMKMARDTGTTIQPAGCGCGGSGGPKQLVYVLGTLKLDFPSRTRRESIEVQLPTEGNLQPRLTEELFLGYLDGKNHDDRKKPWEAQAAEWLLVRNEAPLYAIHPEGPFGQFGYDALREFLADQYAAQRKALRAIVAIAGYLGGQTVLSDGYSVPVLIPEIDGMANFDNKELIKLVDVKEDSTDFKALDNYLIKLWSATENHGIAPQDRALNFAAHNLAALTRSNTDLFTKGFIFDRVEVRRSGTCHPEGECYKVLSYFFKDYDTPRHVIEYTVDVSGVIPVKVSDELEYPAP